ncbi:hypothetical protein PROFUN_07460 [Planoprotostelium fungivorum]|uniref:PH domain-containing protein n=1 Tax=Planoprotostelium fungivorum TaxID=1890364 RepID=A0A2P6NLH5_9EUKA|nr:hypothetical protein PROFUN_07460 [Planoprotostelium fungivorum]
MVLVEFSRFLTFVSVSVFTTHYERPCRDAVRVAYGYYIKDRLPHTKCVLGLTIVMLSFLTRAEEMKWSLLFTMISLAIATNYGEIEVNTDRNGPDLGLMPIFTSSVEECRYSCFINYKCNGWAYDTCGGTNSCWLKSSAGDRVTSQCRSSGLPSKRPGGNVETVATIVQGASEAMFGYGLMDNGGFKGMDLTYKTAMIYGALIDHLDWSGSFPGKDDRIAQGLEKVRTVGFPNKFAGNDWDDDPEWWAITAVRYFETLGDPTWLASAIQVWDYVSDWVIPQDAPCGQGGMLESHSAKYLASIATSLYFTLSAKLHFHLKEDKYLTAALQSKLFIEKYTKGPNCIMDGVAFDHNCSIAADCYTYNTGIYLLGLVELAKTTGDVTYAQTAKDYAKEVFQKKEWYDDRGVLKRDEDNCHDGASFNGQLVRSINNLHRYFPDPSLSGWLTRQFKAVTSYDREPGGDHYGPFWDGPYTNPTTCSLHSVLDVITSGWSLQSGITDTLTYSIVNAAGNALTAAANGSVIVSHGGSRWSLRRTNGDDFLLLDASGRAVTGPKTLGSAVTVEEVTQTDGQLWRIVPEGEERWYTIRNVESGWLLDHLNCHDDDGKTAPMQLDGQQPMDRQGRSPSGIPSSAGNSIYPPLNANHEMDISPHSIPPPNVVTSCIIPVAAFELSGRERVTTYHYPNATVTVVKDPVPTGDVQWFEPYHVGIRSWRGTYLSATLLDVQQAPKMGPWELWKLVRSAGKANVYHLKSWRNTYLCAEENDNLQQRNQPSEWEEWIIMPTSNGKFLLQSYHHTFLTAEDGISMKTKRDSREWQQFEIVRDSHMYYGSMAVLTHPLIAFASDHGKYLSSRNWTVSQMPHKQDWEGSHHGNYLSAGVDGSVSQVHEMRDRELWEIEPIDGGFLIRSAHKTLLRAGSGGHVNQSQSANVCMIASQLSSRVERYEYLFRLCLFLSRSKFPSNRNACLVDSSMNELNPDGIACHICGRYYGFGDLEDHIEECMSVRQKKLKELPNYLPSAITAQYMAAIGEVRSPARPIPNINDEEELQKYNDEATEIFKQSFLTCPKCNRKFGHERLGMHFLHCNGTDAKTLATSETKKAFKDMSSSAQRICMITCYLCGKNYALDMIESHQDKCRTAHRANFRKLAEHTTKEWEDKSPAARLPTASDDDFYIDKYNSQALILFYKTPMPCERCGRSFPYDRLQMHAKSCRPKSTPTGGINKAHMGYHHSKSAPDSSTKGGEKRAGKTKPTQKAPSATYHSEEEVVEEIIEEYSSDEAEISYEDGANNTSAEEDDTPAPPAQQKPTPSKRQPSPLIEPKPKQTPRKIQTTEKPYEGVQDEKVKTMRDAEKRDVEPNRVETNKPSRIPILRKRISPAKQPSFFQPNRGVLPEPSPSFVNASPQKVAAKEVTRRRVTARPKSKPSRPQDEPKIAGVHSCPSCGLKYPGKGPGFRFCGGCEDRPFSILVRFLLKRDPEKTDQEDWTLDDRNGSSSIWLNSSKRTLKARPIPIVKETNTALNTQNIISRSVPNQPPPVAILNRTSSATMSHVPRVDTSTSSTRNINSSLLASPSGPSSPSPPSSPHYSPRAPANTPQKSTWSNAVQPSQSPTFNTRRAHSPPSSPLLVGSPPRNMLRNRGPGEEPLTLSAVRELRSSSAASEEADRSSEPEVRGYAMSVDGGHYVDRTLNRSVSQPRYYEMPKHRTPSQENVTDGYHSVDSNKWAGLQNSELLRPRAGAQNNETPPVFNLVKSMSSQPKEVPQRSNTSKSMEDVRECQSNHSSGPNSAATTPPTTSNRFFTIRKQEEQTVEKEGTTGTTPNQVSGNRLSGIYRSVSDSSRDSVEIAETHFERRIHELLQTQAVQLLNTKTDERFRPMRSETTTDSEKGLRRSPSANMSFSESSDRTLRALPPSQDRRERAEWADAAKDNRSLSTEDVLHMGGEHLRNFLHTITRRESRKITQPEPMTTTSSVSSYSQISPRATAPQKLERVWMEDVIHYTIRPHMWRRRYVRLDNGYMFLFDSDTETRLDRKISLRETYWENVRGDDSAFDIGMTANDMIIHMSAKSQDERDRWTAALTSHGSTPPRQVGLLQRSRMPRVSFVKSKSGQPDIRDALVPEQAKCEVYIEDVFIGEGSPLFKIHVFFSDWEWYILRSKRDLSMMNSGLLAKQPFSSTPHLKIKYPRLKGAAVYDNVDLYQEFLDTIEAERAQIFSHKNLRSIYTRFFAPLRQGDTQLPGFVLPFAIETT